MKYKDLLRRPRVVRGALLFACLGPAVLAFWLSTSPNSSAQEDARKQILRAQLQEGVGRQVRFAHTNASPNDALVAVNSVAGFIAGRSTAVMSEETRGRLAAMETRTLNGQGHRISVDDLTDILTDTAQERLSTLSNADIEHAAQAFNQHGNKDAIMLRANGKGQMKKADFIAQVKAMRDQSQRGDTIFRQQMHAIIGTEVSARIQHLSRALPEKFGNVPGDGMTPAQAVLITYSVASDDSLAHSPVTLRKQGKELHKVMKESGDNSAPKSDKAFGAQGDRFSTPLDLIFNKQTMASLLDKVERRSAQ